MTVSPPGAVGFCVSSVDPGNHSGANYQCKEGSRYVKITVFHTLCAFGKQ